MAVLSSRVKVQRAGRYDDPARDDVPLERPSQANAAWSACPRRAFRRARRLCPTAGERLRVRSGISVCLREHIRHWLRVWERGCLCGAARRGAEGDTRALRAGALGGALPRPPAGRAGPKVQLAGLALGEQRRDVAGSAQPRDHGVASGAAATQDAFEVSGNRDVCGELRRIRHGPRWRSGRSGGLRPMRGCRLSPEEASPSPGPRPQQSGGVWLGAPPEADTSLPVKGSYRSSPSDCLPPTQRPWRRRGRVATAAAPLWPGR